MEDLLSWGITNTWQNGKEGCYLVQHGGHFVNNFGHPQGGGPVPEQDIVFEKVYPTLFPYGVGGIEANCHVDMSLADHVRWSTLR